MNTKRGSQPDYYAEASADIASDAEIGAGCRIWHGVQILSGASIGRDTSLGKGVFVDTAVRIGSGVKVQNYALLYKGSIVHDRVFIGPSVVLANDRYPRAANADGTVKGPGDWKIDGVELRLGASVGSAAVVLPGVIVGEWSLVGAGAIVVDAVPAHALVVGSPARLIGHVCMCGRRLTELSCTNCGRQYVESERGIEFSGAR